MKTTSLNLAVMKLKITKNHDRVKREKNYIGNTSIMLFGWFKRKLLFTTC